MDLGFAETLLVSIVSGAIDGRYDLARGSGQ